MIACPCLPIAPAPNGDDMLTGIADAIGRAMWPLASSRPAVAVPGAGKVIVGQSVTPSAAVSPGVMR